MPQKILNEVGKVVTAEQETFPDIEEANAKKYQGILQRLREKLVHDKRKKILEMNRAREVKELESQDVTKLTPMEKLQMQATIKIHDSTKTHENETLSNKKLKSFNRKFKKNASKAENAEKSQDTKAKGRNANERKGKKGARVKTNKFKQKKPQNKN